MAFALLAVLAPTMATAQELSEATRKQARELHEKGVALIQEGKHAEACAALSAAWGIYPNWRTAGALGTCEFELTQFANAATHLRAFLSDAPSEKQKPEQRQEAQRLLGEAKAKVGTVRVVVNKSGAVVLLNGEQVGAAPIAEPIFVAPGTHSFLAKLNGSEARIEHAVVAGSQSEVRLDFPPDDVSPLNGDTPSYPVVLGVGFGLGGAAVVVGAVPMGVGFGNAADADDKLDALKATQPNAPCATSASPACDEILSLREDADLMRNAALGLLIGGGLVLAATTVFAIVEAPQDSGATSSVSVAPLVSDTTQGATLRITW